LTVNPVKRFDVPVGVFTENCRAPVAALVAIVICTGKLIAVPPGSIVADTPVPVNTMDVAPLKLVPAIVAFMIVPCAPEG
jgi:hypothetical protein